MQGVYSRTIVDLLYAQTQCSRSPLALGVPHTRLPKPGAAEDDVHRAWLAGSVDFLFERWATWTFARHTFGPASASLFALQAIVNREQQVFRLEIGDELRNFRPGPGLFEAPNYYTLVAKVVKANEALCMEARWPEGDSRDGAVVTIRGRDRCTG